jgi:hypothetical protein
MKTKKIVKEEYRLVKNQVIHLKKLYVRFYFLGLYFDMPYYTKILSI